MACLKKTILIIVSVIAAFLFGNLVLSPLFKQYVIPTTGTLKAVDITVKWLDGSIVTSMTWNTVTNGTPTLSDPINITNVKTAPITLLLNTTNHSPSILFLSLSWNYTGAVLQPTDYTIVLLNQTVIADSIAFSYDTNIYAIET